MLIVELAASLDVKLQHPSLIRRRLERTVAVVPNLEVPRVAQTVNSGNAARRTGFVAIQMPSECDGLTNSGSTDKCQLFQGTRMPERMFRYGGNSYQAGVLERGRAHFRQTNRSTSDWNNYERRNVWCEQWEYRMWKLASRQLLFIIWCMQTGPFFPPWKLTTGSSVAKHRRIAAMGVKVGLALDRQ